jgi:hypothetical protein
MALHSFNDDESIRIGYVSSLRELLRAIDETMPKDAVFYVEGTSIVREIRDYLISHQTRSPHEIESGSKWPKPKAFHMSLEGKNLTGLRELARHHAEPEVCDTIVVYQAHEVLLWAHDAGYGYVEVARSLPEELVERFRATLGEALTIGKPSLLSRLFSRKPSA